ncbi:hypothetical protein QP403_22915, partial [Klebsiella michiganensis]|nr:hypothetical protein [Klebsiella michiganensis]
KSAQIREILISESAWEEMTCLFAPSIDQRYNAAAHLHDHCVVSLISYPVRSIKYDTKLIVGVISINIGAQFALIHQKMNG